MRPGTLTLCAAWVSMLLLACGGGGRDVDAGAADSATETALPVVDSRDVTVEGGRVHTLEAGPASGLVVLLLHGGRFRASTWEELGTLSLLAREGYHAIAVDLPGYGDSPSSDVPAERFVAATMDALEIERAVVLSPSMSGKYSLPLLERDPARLAGYVALAPVAIARHAGQIDAPELPALLIWGANDRVVPVADADLLLQRLPAARKVVLEGADHACYLDEPEAFHEALLGFLRELD